MKICMFWTSYLKNTEKSVYKLLLAALKSIYFYVLKVFLKKNYIFFNFKIYIFNIFRSIYYNNIKNKF
jgi:hypothetical protein